MNNSEVDIRERLARAGRELYHDGLTHGTAGNLSARLPRSGSCIIKPSGYKFSELELDSFIEVDIDSGRVLRGAGEPSIETPFHTKLYQKRTNAGCVIHIHPKFSTILSILGVEIVPMGLELYQAPALVKGVPVSEFAFPGSEELADNITRVMESHVACLMPHHGITTIGKTIDEAVVNARVVEKLAELQFHVMLVGMPKSLPDEMIEHFLKVADERGLLL